MATTTATLKAITSQSMLRVCVGTTVCSSVTMQSLSEVATGNFEAHVDVSATNDGKATVRIEIEGLSDWLNDGDVWHLAITDATAATIFDASAQSTYSVTPPDCEGNRCRELNLALP